MSSAFDVAAAALQALTVPADQEELKSALADVLEYWHDANHEIGDVISRKTPIHALERLRVAAAGATK